FRLLMTWNLERGRTDAMLLLGWNGVAMLGAALDWRPSAFIVGEAGTGKSELIKLQKEIQGRGMVSTTNATDAGLYQHAGHDSLPIWIDEMEGDDNAEQAKKLLKMARDAASGSVRIRGGADHKGVEFQARSAFGFSGITPPPIPPANLTRLAIIQLRPLLSADGIVPKLSDPETTGARLLRRLVDQWEDFPSIYETYRTVLREAGHNARGQNTFGTLLACGHMLLGDDGLEELGLPSFEGLQAWGEALAADVVPELQDSEPSWLECLKYILGSPIDNYSHGSRQTVAQVLEQLKENGISLDAARERLGLADLALVEKGWIGDGYGLAIPNKSRTIGKMLGDTKFSDRSGNGSWSWALRQGPPHIVHKAIKKKDPKTGGEKLDNRFTVAGQQQRCTFISLHDFMKHEG
ncbi:hypothetical protein, partial [Labrenzia sp. DG1229]|uniref:hypothetical protein n=1 Tax=Labrenzia sp. DG1229 TaxID=681847 RepID=UPI001AD8EC03